MSVYPLLEGDIYVGLPLKGLTPVTDLPPVPLKPRLWVLYKLEYYYYYYFFFCFNAIIFIIISISIS